MSNEVLNALKNPEVLNKLLDLSSRFCKEAGGSMVLALLGSVVGIIGIGGFIAMYRRSRNYDVLEARLRLEHQMKQKVAELDQGLKEKIAQQITSILDKEEPDNVKLVELRALAFSLAVNRDLRIWDLNFNE